jgi:hypothetical protein
MGGAVSLTRRCVVAIESHSASAMRLEITGPRFGSLNGKRQSFVRGRPRKLRTHRIHGGAYNHDFTAGGHLRNAAERELGDNRPHLPRGAGSRHHRRVLHCHSTLALTAIGCHSLGICTLILLPSPSLSAKMTTSPSATARAHQHPREEERLREVALARAPVVDLESAGLECEGGPQSQSLDHDSLREGCMVVP